MDLIDREHLISVMCNHCTAKERCKANNEESECDDVDILIIRNEPRVEAEPVRHGHWDTIQWLNRCNVCNAIIDTRGTDITWNYCPRCGAKMDVEDEQSETMVDK